MYCHNCGNKNTDEARFCLYCGIELSGNNNNRKDKTNISKKKRKSSKKVLKAFGISSIVFSVVAVALITLSLVVCTFVDIPRIMLNDFEYYLYLEKNNIEDFAGQDLLNIIRKPFSAESVLTGSLSGSALTYDYNSDILNTASILENSKILINADFNGKDVLSFGAVLQNNRGLEILDLAITMLNENLILSSDSLLYDSYNLSKTGWSDEINKEKIEEIKSLFFAAYDHFGKFENYVNVEPVNNSGDKLSKMTFDFDYMFIESLTYYVVDYYLQNPANVDFAREYFEVMHQLDDDDFNELLSEGKFASYRELFSYLVKQELEDLWWIESELEIKYEVVYNKKGEIQTRTLFVCESADDIEYIINCETRTVSDEMQVLEITIDGNETILVQNGSNQIFVRITPRENLEWKLTGTYDNESIDLSLYGCNSKYFCGKDYFENSYNYGTLVLQMDLETDIKDYSYDVDMSIVQNANSLEYFNLEELISKFNYKISQYFSFDM